jgi:hypothetical protein
MIVYIVFEKYPGPEIYRTPFDFLTISTAAQII